MSDILHRTSSRASSLADPLESRRHSPEWDGQRRCGESPYYRMNFRRRGIAAIFNHETFVNCDFNERKGSEKDVESLCRTLERLGFEVEPYIDLCFDEVQSALETLSQSDHSDCDCFVLVYMSHGLEGKLRARDKVFDINILWDSFGPDSAPTLVQKPKIFIIQACQGHGRQKGVMVKEEVDSFDEKREVTLVPRYVLPEYADFLVALSTIPGFVSWRSPQDGSWYIQTLCGHLDRHGFDQDLMTLLTHVGREIAIEYSVHDISQIHPSCQKQLPSVISLLIKKVKFTRKRCKCAESCKRRRSGKSSGNSHIEEDNVETGNSIEVSPDSVIKDDSVHVRKRRKIAKSKRRK